MTSKAGMYSNYYVVVWSILISTTLNRIIRNNGVGPDCRLILFTVAFSINLYVGRLPVSRRDTCHKSWCLEGERTIALWQKPPKNIATQNRILLLYTLLPMYTTDLKTLITRLHVMSSLCKCSNHPETSIGPISDRRLDLGRFRVVIFRGGLLSGGHLCGWVYVRHSSGQPRRSSTVVHQTPTVGDRAFVAGSLCGTA